MSCKDTDACQTNGALCQCLMAAGKRLLDAGYTVGFTPAKCGDGTSYLIFNSSGEKVRQGCFDSGCIGSEQFGKVANELLSK